MHGLDGPARGGFSLRGSETSRLAGPKAERAARSVGPKARKKISELKIKFTKALEICRRRFRRNFDIRIFPKFF
jgi:hypothetical protein